MNLIDDISLCYMQADIWYEIYWRCNSINNQLLFGNIYYCLFAENYVKPMNEYERESLEQMVVNSGYSTQVFNFCVL